MQMSEISKFQLFLTLALVMVITTAFGALLSFVGAAVAAIVGSELAGVMVTILGVAAWYTWFVGAAVEMSKRIVVAVSNFLSNLFGSNPVVA